VLSSITQFYQLAETRLGIPREQIGFVSSDGWDIAAPRLSDSWPTGATATTCRPKCLAWSRIESSDQQWNSQRSWR